MKVVRFGNGDIRLTLTGKEFSKLQQLTEACEVARAKIEASFSDPLKGKIISFLYSPDRNRDCGLDCSEMLKHFNKPPIPVYIGDRGRGRLMTGEPCISRYGPAKLEIKVGLI